MIRPSRTSGRSLTAIPVLAVLVLAAACRPDPYSLLVRTIRPGKPVALPDGYTPRGGRLRTGARR